MSDGRPHALSRTAEAYEYAVRPIKAGAERAGEGRRSPGVDARVLCATGPDSRAAKEAARSMAGSHASSVPEEQLHRTGVEPAEPGPVIEAIGAGGPARGAELTAPEVAERLSAADTPAGCAEKTRARIASSGVDHVVRALTDRRPVRAFTGRDLDGAADTDDQLRLVHGEITPVLT
ncbi:hypothetical protein [Streptomyces caelestis]|uniref:hypothetical protein n=1 Tax=Streptomyces caelestis TaxID=36816 RepID=UPI00364AFD9C